MADDPAHVLETSKDPYELVSTALTLARSAQSRDLMTLQNSLSSATFLRRLDSEEDYTQPRDMLRIALVLEALSKNRSPEATKTLVSLTSNSSFLAEASRIELLIEALAEVRPAPPEVVQFWDKYSHPRGVYANLIIKATLDNRTTPAIALFEQKMTDPAYATGTKVAWMQWYVVPHRNDLPLLESCERLLMKGLPENLRPNLVEVLFDYKASWYLPSDSVNAPPREELSSIGRTQLRKIGEYALENIPLTKEQKQSIQNVLRSLDRSLFSP